MSAEGEEPERSVPELGGLDPDAAIRDRGASGARRSPPADGVATVGEEGAPGGDPADATSERDAVRGLPRVEPVIDTGRYQRIIGLVGLVVVVAFSIYLFARGGNGTPGVAPGMRLHRFVAPLATGGLDATVNAHPVCNRARPARRGLNVCDRQGTVLAFFALDAAPCIHEIDALQAISGRFPGVLFAGVAVGASRQATLALVRSHHWTIPIAYDQAAVTTQLFGIEVCPLVEIARPGGIVTRRLIGKHWLAPSALADAVGSLKG